MLGRVAYLGRRDIGILGDTLLEKSQKEFSVGNARVLELSEARQSDPEAGREMSFEKFVVLLIRKNLPGIEALEHGEEAVVGVIRFGTNYPDNTFWIDKKTR